MSAEQPHGGMLDDPENAALLRERTLRYAEPLHERERERVDEVIEVTRAGARLGLPRRMIRELRVVRMCRLPQTPPTLPGIFHVRGRVCCALDLQPLLGEGEAIEHGARCMIALLADPHASLGLCIDEVEGLREIYRDEIDAEVELGRSDFISAVTPDLLSILDIERLLAREEFSLSPPIHR